MGAPRHVPSENSDEGRGAAGWRHAWGRGSALNWRKRAAGALRGREGRRQGVTVAGGAAGPRARVGAGCGRAGQPLAGHGAVQAEAAAAGVAGRGEVLQVANGDQISGPRTAGGRGWGERARITGSPGRGRRGGPRGDDPPRERLLPGHCGQHSPGRRTGSAHASRGQWRVRHCTLPRCTDRGPRPAGLVVGGQADAHPVPAPPGWTSPGLRRFPLSSPGLLFPSRWQTHQTVAQPAGVRGVGEVGSVGVLFPTESTAWGRGSCRPGRGPTCPRPCCPPSPKCPQAGTDPPCRPLPILSASPLQLLRQQGPGSGWAQGALGQARGWQWAWPP